MPNDFEQRVRRTLSAEEISALRAYRASTPNGNVTFIPRIKRDGQEIVWEARAHLKGAMGPVHATKAALHAIMRLKIGLRRYPRF